MSFAVLAMVFAGATLPCCADAAIQHVRSGREYVDPGVVNISPANGAVESAETAAQFEIEPHLASWPGDLVRMLSALGREFDELRIETMQRVVELDRGLTFGR